MSVPAAWERAKNLGKSVSYLFPDGRLWLDYKADWSVASEEDADIAANTALAGLMYVMQASGLGLTCTDFERESVPFPNGVGFEYLLPCTTKRGDETTGAPTYIGFAPLPKGGVLTLVAVAFVEGQFPDDTREAIRLVLSSYAAGDSCSGH